MTQFEAYGSSIGKVDSSQDLLEEELMNPYHLHCCYSRKPTHISLNNAMSFVGDNSVCQKRIVMILSMTWALFSFLIMGWTFLFLPPIFNCKGLQQDGTEYFYECNEREACSAQEFKIDGETSPQSLALYFGLYCERHYLIGICGSVFFLGAFLGGIIFPQISDKRGRRGAIIIAVIAGGGAAVLAAFSPDFSTFVILTMICGIGFGGFETISPVYISEISGERTQNTSIFIFITVPAFAQLCFSLLVYLQSDWRLICAGFIGGPMLAILLLIYRNFIETPRYLVSKRKFVEARAALDYIATTNRRPKLRARLLGEIDEETNGAPPVSDRNGTIEELDEESKKYGYTDLLCKYKSLAGITRALMFVWFFRYFAYYGLNFSLLSLGADIYRNFSLVALTELLACAVAVRIKFSVKRISSLAGSAIIVAISGILITFFTIPSECYATDQSCYQKSFSPVFALLVKFWISLFANILVTHTSELYPTVVRSRGLGLNMTVGKFGSISMPFIVSALQMEGINPLVSFAFMGVMSAFFIMNLKETLGETPADRIMEVENSERVNLEMRYS